MAVLQGLKKLLSELGNCQLLFCGLHRRLPLILWVPILESKFSNTLKVDWIYIASGLTQILSISFFCLRPSFLYTRHKIWITSLCICSNLFLEPFLRGFECSFSKSWTEYVYTASNTRLIGLKPFSKRFPYKKMRFKGNTTSTVQKLKYSSNKFFKDEIKVNCVEY